MPTRESFARAAGALALIGALMPVRGAAAQASPVGFWNTINDRDGKPQAVVEIREANGEYAGTVRALLVAADRDDSFCSKCSGERRGQPVVGMEILSHMRQRAAGDFGGGEILDPGNGKTYNATMQLTDGGRRLLVRGYIGISLFGRSRPDPSDSPPGADVRERSGT